MLKGYQKEMITKILNVGTSEVLIFVSKIYDKTLDSKFHIK
jgi:hypothetical protein